MLKTSYYCERCFRKLPHVSTSIVVLNVLLFFAALAAHNVIFVQLFQHMWFDCLFVDRAWGGNDVYLMKFLWLQLCSGHMPYAVYAAFFLHLRQTIHQPILTALAKKLDKSGIDGYPELTMNNNRLGPVTAIFFCLFIQMSLQKPKLIRLLNRRVLSLLEVCHIVVYASCYALL